ncbi:MAG: tetratricopeptide repeat protein, partial [Candidatus Sericytochromatia bacterium]|nr:tetratricopeptide repeat protein [Candidatus Tanganyikabacteria bacterium]
FEEAETLLLQALAIEEGECGADNPRLAGTLDRLGRLYRAWDRAESAELRLKRSLALKEKEAAPQVVAEGLDNLADLYLGLGRYQEAEALYIRLLKVQEEFLPADGLPIAATLTALARCHLGQSRPARAEPPSKRALAIREKVQGPHHPEVAGALDNLGYVCLQLGKFAAAETLYKRSLAIAEQTQVADNLDVAICLENYATVLGKLRKKADAQNLEARAQALRAKLPAEPVLQ